MDSVCAARYGIRCKGLNQDPRERDGVQKERQRLAPGDTSLVYRTCSFVKELRLFMEVLIAQKQLLHALARTHGATDRKSSVPMLSSVLLRTQDDHLELLATDLFLSATATCSAEVKTNGALAVASKALLDLVKNMPDGPLTLKRETESQLLIQSGKVRFRVPFALPEAFPELPQRPESSPLVFQPADLLQLIARTQFSMLHDESRPHLSGGLFQGQGKTLRMVSTDGHRLSKAEVDVEGGGFDFSMFIPLRAIGEIKRIAEDLKVSSSATKDPASAAKSEAAPGGGVAKPSHEKADLLELAKEGNHLFVSRSGFSLAVKLSEDAFPPYDRVIPKQASKTVLCDRQSLQDALRRINLVANDKTGGIRLELEAGKLALVSENPEVGEGREELDADYAGEPLTIGFNARYLLDAVGVLLTDRVELALSGELDPGMVSGENDKMGFVGVVMPMRI